MRVDYNLPFQGDKALDLTRIERTRPTVEALLAKGAKVVLLTHFGRPQGQVNPEYSNKKLVAPIRRVFGHEPHFIADPSEAKKATLPVFSILENLRFWPGEEANDAAFARGIAALGDIFVNEGFSVSHRSHASVVGLPQILPSVAGLNFVDEVKALETALADPRRPFVGIVGGAKLSTKLPVIESLLKVVDKLIIGGNMAPPFVKVQGKLTACKSLDGQPQDHFDMAEALLNGENGRKLVLPVDGVLAGSHKVKAWEEMTAEDLVFDAGPASVEKFKTHLADAQTIVWNGPLGKFEEAPFYEASKALAKFIAQRTQEGAYTLIGGGETLATFAMGSPLESVSHASTAGGAFLSWLSDRTLPGVEALLKGPSTLHAVC